jgi:Tfp pilus assembly protein PilO
VNRRIPLIAGAALAVVLLAWFGLLWRPQSAKIDEARTREEAAVAQNAQLELELARLQEASERRTELIADQDLLRAAVPDDAALAQFILDGHDAAEAAEIDFVSIAPGEPSADVDPSQPTSVSLSIGVEGGYFQLLDYLNRILAFDRVVVIDSLTMAPKEVGNADLIRVDITARMFTTAVPAPADGSAPVEPAPAEQAPAEGEQTVPVENTNPSEGTVLGAPTEEAQ